MDTNTRVRSGCACQSLADVVTESTARRGFFRLLVGVGASALFTPLCAWPQKKPTYEAMLLSCIDPRIIDPVHNYMNARGLDGKYSQFTIGGAAVGAEAEAFASWHQTFWDNLATSIEFHKIKSVIAIDHRDCGAARLAFGDESVADRSAETDTHKRVLTAFRHDVRRHHPKLKVETGLMALDGNIEMFAS
jgi:carbonic anhydrase